MAFVARRSTEGKLVERQQLSGRGTSSRNMSMTDISDDDDTDTMLGYTNRTFSSPPTVRYVGEESKIDDIIDDDEDEKEIDEIEEDEDPDTDVETSYTFAPQKMGSVSSLDTNVDTIMNFCNELDECEREDRERERRQNLKDNKEVDPELTDTEDDLDLETYKRPTPRAGDRVELPIDTETETLWDNNNNQDTQSLSSFESLQVPAVTPAITSIDAQSAKTYFVGKAEDTSSGLMTNRTYDLSTGSSVRKTDASSVSACSWTDMYGGALKPSESRSNIVPSLSLGSCDSEASTYFKTLKEKKGGRMTESAYEDWIARKERQKQEKIRAAKMEKEKKESEAALRQRLSKERFEQWCKRKEEQQKKPMGLVNAKGSVSSRPSTGTTSSFAATHAQRPVKPPTKETLEATKKRLKEWERVKIEKQQQERERKRQLEERKNKLEQEQKQRTKGAWNKWMKHATNRPKPVPLNQGIDTLRGTVSNIYINPIPWVSNIDTKDSRGR